MISLEWVKDYIDISDENLYDLAEKIKKAGINVEAVISNHIDNLVIGEIIECNVHPDSDHLKVCKVNVGDNVLQIVCGASNVKAGIKVIVALPGAILPSNLEIKKSKIRGVQSNGMICALFEIGLEEKNDDNYNKGIYIVSDDIKVGTDAMKALSKDTILYELDIHKHRNNDCYYHIGFAYEIAAILNKKVTLPESNFNTISDRVSDHLSLSVETDKCPYYLARMVTDVKIGDSPEFIKRRLNDYGMRSINNVVDISNYVMLEYGQPLHFFDKDSLGDKIVVRDALEGEKITTLDSIDRTLTSDDIVITDGKKAVCIAGVMGGLNTEVTSSTKNILIESAIFDSVSIRYTASRLNLKSEASIRYGKGLSFEYTNKAMDRACYLLQKYASAKVLDGTIKYDKVDKTPKVVEFKTSEINELLGLNMTDSDVKTELSRLDFDYVMEKDLFKATIPFRRLDIDPFVNDIAEEVGRLYGYNNLKSTLPICPIKKGEYKGDVKYKKIISDRLRTMCLNECRTYTLVSPKEASMFNYDHKENLILPNPMSIDKSVIRTSLLPSLINVYNYNKKRKVENINIYEISKTYDANYNEESKIAILMEGDYLTSNFGANRIKTDFYLVKGIIESLLVFLGFENRYSFVKENISSLHPKIGARILLDGDSIGIIGKVHPKILKDDVYVAEISLNALMRSVKPIKYKEPSKYPFIVKDMAFAVSKDITSFEIESVIKKSGGNLLKSVKVFDLYTGDKISKDEKSIAYSLTFGSENRTLKEEEVIEVFDKIIKDVCKKLNARLRDK